jgi:hypothetical protein
VNSLCPFLSWLTLTLIKVDSLFSSATCDRILSQSVRYLDPYLYLEAFLLETAQTAHPDWSYLHDPAKFIKHTCPGRKVDGLVAKVAPNGTMEELLHLNREKLLKAGVGVKDRKYL